MPHLPGDKRKIDFEEAQPLTDDMECGELPNMGDGLLMAWEVGATSEGLGILQLVGSVFTGGGEGLGPVATEPNTIWVNKEGGLTQ